MNSWTIIIGFALAKGAAFSLGWLLLGSLRSKASAASLAMWWRIGLAGWIAVEIVALLPSVWSLRLPRSVAPLFPVSEAVEAKVSGLPHAVAVEAAPPQVASASTAPSIATRPATAPLASPTFRPTAMHWFGLPWLAGVLLCLLRFFFGVIRVERLRSKASDLDDEHWLHSLREKQLERGIARKIALLEHSAVAAPFATGWRRPAIVLPATAREWDAAKREAVLRHEFAHIARHDLAWMWFASFAAALHWFSPLAWKFRERLVLAQERAADDVVLESGVQGVHYASLLAAAASEGLRLSCGPAVAPMARRSTLGQRVGRLLDSGQDRSAPGFLFRAVTAVSACALVLALGLTGLLAATGKDSKAPPRAFNRTYRDTYRLEESFTARFPGSADDALAELRKEFAAAKVQIPEDVNLSLAADKRLLTIEFDSRQANSLQGRISSFLTEKGWWENDDPYQRTAQLQEKARPWIDAIIQLDDPTRRDVALAEIKVALTESDSPRRAQALAALARCMPVVEFDKAAFRPLIESLLKDTSGSVRAVAVGLLVSLPPDDADLNRALSLVEDPATEVQTALGFVLFRLSKGDLTSQAGEAVLRLLATQDARARMVIVQSLWGAKFSPHLEARLAELARAPEDIRANGVVYYALSTQQNKGKDCIDILIRDLSDEDSFNVGGRAMWGMGYGVQPDQQPRVADAALKVFQARTDGYLRKQSLRALTNYGRVQQVEALQAVAQKPGVTAELQTEIGRTIASIRARSDSK